MSTPPKCSVVITQDAIQKLTNEWKARSVAVNEKVKILSAAKEIMPTSNKLRAEIKALNLEQFTIMRCAIELQQLLLDAQVAQIEESERLAKLSDVLGVS